MRVRLNPSLPKSRSPIRKVYGCQVWWGEHIESQSFAPEVSPVIHHTRISWLANRISSGPAPGIPSTRLRALCVLRGESLFRQDARCWWRRPPCLRVCVLTLPEQSFAPEVSVSDVQQKLLRSKGRLPKSQSFAPEVSVSDFIPEDTWEGRALKVSILRS